jgi:hypothetical protein
MKLIKLHNDKHKYQAIFKDGKKTKFGASGYSDFLHHHDVERRDRYRDRHKKDLETHDPHRAGFLSYYILWNKPTLSGSLKDFNSRFNV